MIYDPPVTRLQPIFNGGFAQSHLEAEATKQLASEVKQLQVGLPWLGRFLCSGDDSIDGTSRNYPAW